MRNRFILSFLVIGSILVFNTSCSLFKMTSKNIEKQTSQIVVKKDSNETTSDLKNVKKQDTQKDIETVVTEKETTTKTTTKESSTKVSGKKEDLHSKGKLTLSDSLGRKIIVSLDSLSNILTVEVEAPEKVEEVTVKEKKTEQKDKTKESKSDSTATLHKQVAITQNEEKNIKSEKVDKKSSIDPMTVLGIFVGIAFVIVAILFTLRKYFKIL